MDGLKVHLFGKLVVQRAGLSIEGLHSSKVQELFGYLLLNRARPHTRESLSTLLWPESTANISRKYLRQALWQLHLALMDHANCDETRLFVIEDHSVRVESRSPFWLDVDVFERAASDAQELSGEKLGSGRAQRLAEAATFYRGDLLEGWYFDWCICERERLQSMYLTMLDKLMAWGEVTAEYERGLAYGEQILKYDRARERTYQRMMRLQTLAGDRAGALRQFQRCSISLDEELGVRPSRQTLEIYQAIRADRLPLRGTETPAREQPRDEEVAAREPDSSAPRGRLMMLRTLLCEIQHRVQEDIRALDQVLCGSPSTTVELDAADVSEKEN